MLILFSSFNQLRNFTLNTEKIFFRLSKEKFCQISRRKINLHKNIFTSTSAIFSHLFFIQNEDTLNVSPAKNVLVEQASNP